MNKGWISSLIPHGTRNGTPREQNGFYNVLMDFPSVPVAFYRKQNFSVSQRFFRVPYPVFPSCERNIYALFYLNHSLTESRRANWSIWLIDDRDGRSHPVINSDNRRILRRASLWFCGKRNEFSPDKFLRCALGDWYECRRGITGDWISPTRQIAFSLFIAIEERRSTANSECRLAGNTGTPKKLLTRRKRLSWSGIEWKMFR